MIYKLLYNEILTIFANSILFTFVIFKLFTNVIEIICIFVKIFFALIIDVNL